MSKTNQIGCNMNKQLTCRTACLAGRRNWYECLGSTWMNGMDLGFNCKSCLLSDDKDRLWTLYSKRALEWLVTSANNLNSVKNETRHRRLRNLETHWWLDSNIGGGSHNPVSFPQYDG